LSFYASAQINDNVPVFSPTAYTFYVNFYASAGYNVGSVTVSDADLGSYGVLTLALDQTSLGGDYFAIDNNGEITTKQALTSTSISYGTSYVLTATASDVGGNVDSAFVTLIISGI